MDLIGAHTTDLCERLHDDLREDLSTSGTFFLSLDELDTLVFVVDKIRLAVPLETGDQELFVLLTALHGLFELLFQDLRPNVIGMEIGEEYVIRMSRHLDRRTE